MNMPFIKSTKFSTCAFMATAFVLSACSGGGGETALNDTANTTEVTTTSLPTAVTGYLTVPSGLRTGQTAMIEGHGYQPDAAYSLTIHDPAGGISTQNVSVGANGDFKFQLTLPQAGLYTATAVDNGTGNEVGKVIVSAMSE